MAGGREETGRADCGLQIADRGMGTCLALWEVLGGGNARWPVSAVPTILETRIEDAALCHHFGKMIAYLRPYVNNMRCSRSFPENGEGDVVSFWQRGRNRKWLV
ncbi:hypothetical protein HQ563_18500 [bacterium]|nr:hypothetical protein [bacterium]